MNVKNVRVVISLICVSSMGCASMSNRTKTILTTVGVGLAAGGVGYATTPEGTLPMAHAGLWAGIGAATAGVASLFIYDSEADKKKLLSENEKLGLELAAFQEGITPHLTDVLHESPNMPDTLRRQFKPGDWYIYKIGKGESALWRPKGNNNNYLENVCRVAVYTRGGIAPLAPSQLLNEGSPNPPDKALLENGSFKNGLNGESSVRGSPLSSNGSLPQPERKDSPGRDSNSNEVQSSKP